MITNDKRERLFHHCVYQRSSVCFNLCWGVCLALLRDIRWLSSFYLGIEGYFDNSWSGTREQIRVRAWDRERVPVKMKAEWIQLELWWRLSMVSQVLIDPQSLIILFVVILVCLVKIFFIILFFVLIIITLGSFNLREFPYHILNNISLELNHSIH